MFGHFLFLEKFTKAEYLRISDFFSEFPIPDPHFIRVRPILKRKSVSGSESPSNNADLDLRAPKSADTDPRALKVRIRIQGSLKCRSGSVVQKLRIRGTKKCGSRALKCGSLTLKKNTLLHVVLHSTDQSSSVSPVDVQHYCRDVDENQNQTKIRKQNVCPRSSDTFYIISY